MAVLLLGLTMPPISIEVVADWPVADPDTFSTHRTLSGTTNAVETPMSITKLITMDYFYASFCKKGIKLDMDSVAAH